VVGKLSQHPCPSHSIMLGLWAKHYYHPFLSRGTQPHSSLVGGRWALTHTVCHHCGNNCSKCRRITLPRTAVRGRVKDTSHKNFLFTGQSESNYQGEHYIYLTVTNHSSYNNSGKFRVIFRKNIDKYCGEPTISLHSQTVSLVQWLNPLLPVIRDPGSIPGGYLCETGILLLALSRYIGDPNVIDHCGLV
jgi:hypothetical protein